MFALQMDSFLKLGENKKLIQYRIHTHTVADDDIVDVKDTVHISRSVTGRLKTMTPELEQFICRLHLDEGLDRYQIAKQLKINYETVRKVLGKHKLNPERANPMTEADISKAIEMFTDHGMSATRIAHKLGWSPQTICNHLHKAGVMARLTQAQVAQAQRNVERQSNALQLVK